MNKQKVSDEDAETLNEEKRNINTLIWWTWGEPNSEAQTIYKRRENKKKITKLKQEMANTKLTWRK